MSAHDWRIILYEDMGQIILRCTRCGCSHSAHYNPQPCAESGAVYAPEEM